MKKFLAIVLAAATIGMGAAGMAGCKDNLKPIVEREDKNIVVGVTNYKPMDYLEKGEWASTPIWREKYFPISAIR